MSASNEASKSAHATAISTYTGNRFSPFATNIDELIVKINFEDIASGLSNICRFNGQTHGNYSVAQHSLIVASQVPPEYRLHAMLHDASEAYLGDVIKPLKTEELMPGYLVLEHRVEQAIFKKFGLEMTPEIKKIIKRADYVALATEKRDLMPNALDEEWEYLIGVEPLSGRIYPLPPHEAKANFKEIFHSLLAGDIGDEFPIDMAMGGEISLSPWLGVREPSDVIAEYLAKLSVADAEEAIRDIRTKVEARQRQAYAKALGAIAAGDADELRLALRMGARADRAMIQACVSHDFGADQVLIATHEKERLPGGVATFVADLYVDAVTLAAAAGRSKTLARLLDVSADDRLYAPAVAGVKQSEGDYYRGNIYGILETAISSGSDAAFDVVEKLIADDLLADFECPGRLLLAAVNANSLHSLRRLLDKGLRNNRAEFEEALIRAARQQQWWMVESIEQSGQTDWSLSKGGSSSRLGDLAMALGSSDFDAPAAQIFATICARLDRTDRVAAAEFRRGVQAALSQSNNHAGLALLASNEAASASKRPKS